MENTFLTSSIKLFKFYKELGEDTFGQVSEEKLFWQFNEDSNSIASIVKHLWGNMLSRWTDFLTSDGEKEWRKRDEEFENDIKSKAEMMEKWEEGWKCLLDSLESLSPAEMEKVIYIRNEGHTVMEAMNRQLGHYAYHVGQIVFLGKMLADNDWESLSIPKGKSEVYNAKMFSKEQKKTHFTDGFSKK